MRYYNLNERRMVGPATAARTGEVDEIAEMREMLDNGIVEFTFTKADGSERHAKGTTSEQIIPVADRRRLDPHYDENVASYEARASYIIWFWDLEKNEVRCFSTNRFGEIINYERTTRRAVIDQEGNDFVHRDAQEVRVPNGVTSIRNGEFEGYSALKNITIPNSVTRIGHEAFRDCESLKNITIPNSVTEIGVAAFSGCSALKSVTIPDSVTTIGNHAFERCSADLVIKTNNEYVINYCIANHINYTRMPTQTVDPEFEGDAEEPVELTTDRIAEINDVLDNVGRLISTGDFGDMSYGRSLDCNLVVDHGDPVIKININKKFGLDDEPYQLEIAELCTVVKLRFNVEIKRVEVTGVFKLK